MKFSGTGQLSAAKTGWLVLLLFFGWLAFLLMPSPKPKPEPLPVFVVNPQSHLVALGLPDNPDLEHLPEFFALYADKAPWTDDKAVFAYWNPGANRYSYLFEATRNDGVYHFRVLSEKDPDYELLSGFVEDWDGDPPEAAPVQFLYSNFNNQVYNTWTMPQPPVSVLDRRKFQLKLNWDSTQVVVQPPEIKINSTSEQKH